MKKTSVIAIIIAATSVILAVISFILLPDVVVTQLSLGGNATTMSKPVAVALPSLLGLGGSIVAFISKGEKSAYKALIVGGVGLLIFAIMLAVNLL